MRGGAGGKRADTRGVVSLCGERGRGSGGERQSLVQMTSGWG